MKTQFYLGIGLGMAAGCAASMLMKPQKKDVKKDMKKQSKVVNFSKKEDINSTSALLQS